MNLTSRRQRLIERLEDEGYDYSEAEKIADDELSYYVDMKIKERKEEQE